MPSLLRRGAVAASRVSAASIPTFVAASIGGASAADSANTTRPGGTAAGDHLFLVFHVPNAESTAPTFTGWTKLSGYDLVNSPKFAIYDRIADLTATDQPNINPTSGDWYGGWSMVAIRGGATISVPVAKTTAAVSITMTSPVVTTTAPNSLILSIGIVGNNTSVAAPSGGPVDRYRSPNTLYVAVGVATEDMAVAGVGHAATWSLGGSMNSCLYALALTT